MDDWRTKNEERMGGEGELRGWRRWVDREGAWMTGGERTRKGGLKECA